jgi:hypothetical protein
VQDPQERGEEVVEHCGIAGQDGGSGEASDPSQVLAGAVLVRRRQAGDPGICGDRSGEDLVDGRVADCVESERFRGGRTW